MAVVDTDFLAGARTLYKAAFDEIMGAAPGVWQRFATLFDTEGKATLGFDWLGAPPMMRTMVDTLTIGKSFEHNYTIAVDETGVGIEIKEQAYMSNPLGTILKHVENMMVQASKYYDKVCIEALSDGFTATGFDSASFFNAAHTIGDGASFDNSDTAALDNAGATYQVAWQKLNAAEDDSGEPMGFIGNVLIVHSNNRLTARQLLNAEIISQTSNVLVDDSELIVSPWVSTSTHWFLGAGGQPVNPIVLAEQMAPRFVAMDGLDSPNAFHGNRFQYKVDAKVSVGYGDPRTMIGSNGTT
uniref:Putative capsid protein n=1 Tax=viral metagenome TaxID=1070528 RepID=A0A6M3K0X3_9ZZZZ